MKKKMGDKNQQYQKVYLDLDGYNNQIASDEELGTLLIDRYKINKVNIAKRYRKFNQLGVLHASQSVALFASARDIFSLGYFYSTIMVCRSIAEFLVKDIFRRHFKTNDDVFSEFILNNLDFRKITNEYLKSVNVLSRTSIKKLNDVYDIGNYYVHAKKLKSRDPEADASKLLSNIKDLILEHSNYLKTHKIVNGVLTKK